MTPADAARMRFKPDRHALEGVERAERVLADARARVEALSGQVTAAERRGQAWQPSRRFAPRAAPRVLDVVAVVAEQESILVRGGARHS
jgi:hypothetical protein